MWLSKFLRKWKRSSVNQYMAASAASLGYALVGASVAWPSPTFTKMASGSAPVKLDVSQISWMVSLMFLGHLTSPLPSGYLMDWFGCKRTCLILTVLPFTSWMMILFATSPKDLYIARYAAGLWNGVTSTLVPIYVGEIATKDLRSSLLTINNLFYNFGILFAYIVGANVSYNSLAVGCGVLTFLFFFTFLFVPESPYYLIKRDQIQDAFEALSWLRGEESKENIDIEIKTIKQAIDDENLQKGSLKELVLDRGNRKALTIALTYAVIKRASGSGVLQAYASATLPVITFGSLDADTCVVIIGIVSFFASVVSTVLSAKFRQRVLILISCGGCFIATTVIGVWFYFHDETFIDVRNYSDVVFGSFVLFYITYNVGLGPTGTSIKGELFSGNVKALSSSVSTMLVAGVAFVLNKYYLILGQVFGMYVNYVLFSTACVYCMLFTIFYVPCMHNKSLEEIQELFKDKNKPNGYLSNSKPSE